jgi:hypothetical protein
LSDYRGSLTNTIAKKEGSIGKEQEIFSESSGRQMDGEHETSYKFVVRPDVQRKKL